MSAMFYFESSSGNPSSFFEELHLKIDTLTALEREEFEERAAIMEYEGQLSNEEAEWRALRIIFENRMKIAV